MVHPFRQSALHSSTRRRCHICKWSSLWQYHNVHIWGKMLFLSRSPAHRIIYTDGRGIARLLLEAAAGHMVAYDFHPIREDRAFSNITIATQFRPDLSEMPL